MPRFLLCCTTIWFASLLLVGRTLAIGADEANDPELASPDFKTQGEYVGKLATYDGQKAIGVQVIALGSGKLRAVSYLGGLPGDGWDKSPRQSAEGEIKDGKVEFHGDEFNGVLKDRQFSINVLGGVKLGELKKVERKSSTLGAIAPAGAVVLFDGTNADQFEKGRITNDGLLMEGCTSKPKFQSGTLHVEFRLPYMPQARGQQRGNSGCYMQGCYEVQMLDSFGLDGKDNECGGIYSIRAPEVNMCFPPYTWQTYDIDFTAAKYENGKKVEDPVITVKHNGVPIYKDVKLTHATPSAPNAEGAEPGPVFLQDHGNPVRYRNIWFVEKK